MSAPIPLVAGGVFARSGAQERLSRIGEVT